MSDVQPPEETFSEFKDSFSYGSRNDLAFKFLKRLDAPGAAEFFRALLEKLGESIDDGNADRLIEHAYEWQIDAYAEAETHYRYDDASFTRLGKPLTESRLALLTSSGHFVAGDDPRPFSTVDMTQAEAVARINDFLREPPRLSAIPIDTPSTELRVRHGGYDIRAAEKDPNVVFPLDRLRELVSASVIGELAPNAYSFVGAAAQTPLKKAVAPRWAAELREQGVDAVLLVPV